MQPPDSPPPTTHLIARNHDSDSGLDDYADVDGTCAFCGHDGLGLSVADAVNHDYFSDDPLMQADTGHVCQYCAYCMNADRALKQGHWIATTEKYDRISTSNLPDAIKGLRTREYGPPYAFYIARDPILSLHSYHWTPVAASAARLLCVYDRETVRIGWGELDALIAAIEDLRWHGFRLDDIRSGEPRVRNLVSVGRDQYRELDRVIEPYRRTGTLELALTLSRAADDQDREKTQNGDATLSRFT